jgi:NADPH:quinone reductase
MKAIVMNGTGGREMLEYVERPDPASGPGQALVEIAFAGVNFMDIGVRRGTVWNEMRNPKILGVEGVGRVVAAGDGVEGIAAGQRIAWVYAPGSYAERIAIPATSLVPVPDAIDDRTAASVMMQGLTASHFATDFYPVQPGEFAFVHAAAGGLGLLPHPDHQAAGRPCHRARLVGGEDRHVRGGRCRSCDRRCRGSVRRGGAPADPRGRRACRL